jgi:Fe2+ transport system protein FeoA
MADLVESASLWLDGSCKGSRLIVRKIPDGRSRTQLIRLGIVEGEEIGVVERMPGGTVVIEKNRREIAIGAALARTIRVDIPRKLRALAHA